MKRRSVLVVLALLICSPAIAGRTTMVLNSAAVADINQKSGGYFSVGGALLSIGHAAEGVSELVFGGVAYTETQRLIVEAGGTEHTFTTADSLIVAGRPNQGWWSNAIPASPSNSGYVTGSYAGIAEFRSFLTFDLSALGGTVTGARLDICEGDFGEFGKPIVDSSETLGLFAVETDALTLNQGSGLNATIFNDLGSGTSYGEFEISCAASQIPAPGAIMLSGMGLGLVNWLRRRRAL